jgi:7-carboxy-7-deazaguanine synthase
MNTQKPTPVNYSNSQCEVEEIFYTLQGEGPFTGHPAVFIRLSGCTLCCAACDSEYSSFYSMTVEDVVEQAVNIQHNAQLAVITGGEPFRQYPLAPLIDALLQRFLTVQIETSGSCYQPTFTALKKAYPEHIKVVCSPKTPRLHPLILQHIDAYKYVVRFGHVDEDGLPNEEPQKFKLIPVAKPHDPQIPVYISPWDEKDLELNILNTQQAVDVCLKHGYFLSLQIHKIVNLP